MGEEELQDERINKLIGERKLRLVKSGQNQRQAGM